MRDKVIAFVIMPFTDELNGVYDDLVKKSLEGEGYTVIRADEFSSQQNIIKDIIRGIACLTTKLI